MTSTIRRAVAALAFTAPLLSASAQKQLVNTGEILKNAETLLGQEKYNDAIKLYKSISRSDTNFVHALNNLSIAYDADSNFVESRRYAELGLQLFPEKASQWHMLIAKSHLESNDYKQAIEFYDKIISTHPNPYIALFNKGITYYRQDQFAEAKKYFQQTVLMNPYYASAHYYLGVIAFNEGNLVPAILSYCTNLLMDPEGRNRGRSVQGLAAISEVNDEASKNFKAKKMSDRDDFSLLEDIIVSKIALDRQYKLMVPLEDNIVRQLQVTLEKLEYNESDGGFWMQYYVPYFQSIYRQKQFEPFVNYIFSGLTIKDVQTYLKKNKKEVDAFTGSANTFFEDIKETREPNLAKRAPIRLRYLYSGTTLVGKGEWKYDGKESHLIGPWEFYHENGIIKSKGVFDDKYEKTGEWVFYYENGQLKEKTLLDHGVLSGKSTNWYSNGRLMEDGIYKNDKHAGELTRYYFNGLPSIVDHYADGVKSGTTTSYTSAKVLEYTAQYTNDKEEGEVVYYHPNGTIESKVIYKAGQPEGLYRRYYADGVLKLEGNFTAGKRNGEWKEYYNSSQLKNTANYLDNEMHGSFVEMHDNGKVMTRANYNKGSLEGRYEEFSGEGKLFSESTFEKGKLKELKYFDKEGKLIGAVNRPGSGMIIVYDANGNKVSEGLFTKDGNRNGKSTFFFPGGKTSSVAHYKDGVLNGERTVWYKNGQIREKVNYTDDEEDGYKQLFYEHGTLSHEGMVVEGKKEGLHIDYNEFGAITSKSNYLDGDLHGYLEYYNPDGRLTIEEKFENGWLTHVRHYDSSGRVSSDVDMKKGDAAIQYKSNGGNAYVAGEYKHYNLHGPYKFQFVDGATETVQFYKYGILDSVVERYYPTGKLRLKGNYKMGEKHGKWEYFHDNGKPHYTQVYNNGRLNGSYQVFNEDGTLDRELTCKENELDGPYRIYGENRQLAVELRFSNGEITGYTYQGKDGNLLPVVAAVNGSVRITAYYKNGVKSVEETYELNELTGSRKLYFSTGKPYVDGTLVSGYDHGTKTIYYPNNQVQRVEEYYYDNLHGSVKSYHENGKLKSEEQYYNGKRHGKQNYYDASGTMIKTLAFYYDVPEPLSNKSK